jgi:pilus assembly protein CpaE
MVREGAEDYLIKETVTAHTLSSSLRFAVERNRAKLSQKRGKPGKIFTFMGAKGGVGTTTVALNVAAVLAQRDCSVIALELRAYYGSFWFQLGGAPSSNLLNPA